MTGQCSICLSALKEPVSIPCGHVYCSECLGEYISSGSQDGYTATCPTCRTEFPIVTPERTCLPKQVHRYLFPTIRRVYIDASPANTAEIQRLQHLLNTSQIMQRRLEDQVDHLMEQCERHMASSRAHAEGEMDALHEVERLKRRLKQEMDARKRAEEATEEALEEIGRLNLAAVEHEAQSLSEEAEKVNLRWQLECEQEKTRRLSVMNPQPLVMSSRTRQSTSNPSPVSRPSKRRLPSQDLSESDHERKCSDDDCSCEDSDEDLSPQTPINYTESRRTTNSTSSTRGMLPNTSFYNTSSSSTRPGYQAQSSCSFEGRELSEDTSRSAITPRRRIMRDLPQRPPTKRVRVSGQGNLPRLPRGVVSHPNEV